VKDPLTRRTFLGASSAIAGTQFIVPGAKADASEPATPSFAGGTSLYETTAELVGKTPFVDTHEHFVDESLRVRGAREEVRHLAAPDFGMLLCHYTDSDLQVAGMPAEDYKQTQAWNVPLSKKWELAAPYYERCRHTGYQLCIRETLRALFDEEDLRADNYERISQRLQEHAAPGFYTRLLRDIANIEYAHVNYLQKPLFAEMEPADLLGVDLSINPLCAPPDLKILEKTLGSKVTTLPEAMAAIDACFDQYGSKAVAIKSQCAYWRSLNFLNADAKDAAPLFKRYARKASLSSEELEIIQGFMFHYCMKKAAEYGLVVKLHTGYYAGHGGMPLARVRDNLSDLCPILKEHPDTMFSLFHIAYPYQDEAIAIAKQYRNACVDMCWAWIINPAASVRFLKEFIMAAPACKLFAFGGDYIPVEMSVGHAAIARRGVTQAIVELIQEGWLAEGDAPSLVERIMRGNALEIFAKNRRA